MATFGLNTFFDSLDRKLEAPVKTHLKYVYSSMSIAMISAALGAYVHLYTNIFSGGILSLLATIGFVIALMVTPHNAGKNDNVRLAYLNGFAFCSGLNTGPLLNIAIIINPSIIPIAFLSTCVIFLSFSLSSIFGDTRKTLYMGGLLMAGMSLLIMLSLINLFIGSIMLQQTYLYLSFFILCGFIIYDTALIIEKRRIGDTDYIWHSILLFIDFLDVFRHIVIILLQKEDRRDRRRNSK